MRLFIFLSISAILVLNCCPAFTQNYLVNAGARSFGISDANSCLADVHSPINNVAGIAGSQDMALSFSAQNYYDNIGINDLYLTLIYPLKNFGTSLHILKHGNEYLSQQKIGLGIANQVGFVKMGLQVDYLQYKAEGFGSGGSILFEFGGIAELTEKITLGASIFNFTQSSLKKSEEEQLPVIMKAGINYQVVPNFQTYLEIEKEILSEPLFKAGIEYEILPDFFCRTGITVNPTKNFFGIGYHSHKIGFDYGFSYHQYLGLTHQASLLIKIKSHE